MAIEIERKFLVSGDGWRSIAGEGTRYRQGYLATGPRSTVRVRIGGTRAWLCVKGATEGITRAEFEYEIPASDAEALLALCALPPVEKTRHVIQQGGGRWEVDEFHGRNAGLVLAEVELTDAAAEVLPPDWVGPEVSHDRRYFNSALAARPFGEWGGEEPASPPST